MPRPAELGIRIGSLTPGATSSGATCARLARRIGLRLARTGSTAHHGSGEIFLAASTTWRADRTNPEVHNDSLRDALNPLFEAVVDCAEQAVLDSMLMATTTVGRNGNTSEGLDPDRVRKLLR